MLIGDNDSTDVFPSLLGLLQVCHGTRSLVFYPRMLPELIADHVSVNPIHQLCHTTVGFE